MRKFLVEMMDLKERGPPYIAQHQEEGGGDLQCR